MHVGHARHGKADGLWTKCQVAAGARAGCRRPRCGAASRRAAPAHSPRPAPANLRDGPIRDPEASRGPGRMPHMPWPRGRRRLVRWPRVRPGAATAAEPRAPVPPTAGPTPASLRSANAPAASRAGAPDPRPPRTNPPPDLHGATFGARTASLADSCMTMVHDSARPDATGSIVELCSPGWGEAAAGRRRGGGPAGGEPTPIRARRRAGCRALRPRTSGARTAPASRAG